MVLRIMDVDALNQANSVANLHHRKVELQSPQDFTYLQANLVASARQKLDLHFPPSALQKNARGHAQPATVISLDGVKPLGSHQDPKEEGGQEEEEDPLRAHVRQLVDAFITRTWDGAAKNITVNGMDATSLAVLTRSVAPSKLNEPEEEREGVDFAYEAYDTRLQSRVAGLYGELEALTAQVSRLRRTAPKQGSDGLRDKLAEEMVKEQAGFEAQVAALREGATDAGAANLDLQPVRDGWHDDVKAMYERGTGGLAALAGLHPGGTDTSLPLHHGSSLTETMGKVQRGRTVAMEFE